MGWRLYILFFLLLFLFKGNAQDQHFSQFYANPLYLSPSLAGSTDGSRLVLNYRNQWPAISEAFSTVITSYSIHYTKLYEVIDQPIASAGDDDTACALSYALAGSASIGDGTWTQISGVGTATFTNDQFRITSYNVCYTKLLRLLAFLIFVFRSLKYSVIGIN